MPAAELVVSFLDGAVRSVQRETPWWPFIHEGDAVEWCSASTLVEGARVAVVAVRLRGTDSTIVGATIESDDQADVDRAARILDAHGGPAKLRQSTSTKAWLRSVPPPPKHDLKALGLSGTELTNFLSQQYRIPTIALGDYEIDADVIAIVPEELCARHRVIPVSRAGTSLIVAVVDPTDQKVLDALREATSMNVEPVIATEHAVAAAITRYYGGRG